MNKRKKALDAVITAIDSRTDNISDQLLALDNQFNQESSSAQQTSIRQAWFEYRETMLSVGNGENLQIHNTVRPQQFFNLEDLHFGAGGWKVVPGMFVSVGLFLTFLGLISALNSMSTSLGNGGSAALEGLLTIASAKFIMSLMGLFCSIIFTIVQRRDLSAVDVRVFRLNSLLEKRLSYISLEYIAQQQLEATIESREHFRLLGMEMVAELGRPLREDLPKVISESISQAITPVIEQVSRLGNDGVGEMVESLSTRFSNDVGQALTQASDRISLAGDQIRMLAERMDQSSGRMGDEMEQVISRLGQAVESLTEGMASSAGQARELLTQGTESLLSTMNITLQGIKDNTSDGANAMREAAEGMKMAAVGIREELETAARQGSEAARLQFKTTTTESQQAISLSTRDIIQSIDQAANSIHQTTHQVSQKASEQLLIPLDEIAHKLKDVVKLVSESGTQLRRSSEGIKEGAQATEQASRAFQESSQSLVTAADPVRAMVERIENMTRQLRDSTENQLSTIAYSAKANAESSAVALKSAQETLGGQHKAIESTLLSLQSVINSLKGQGQRLEDIDITLGKAFESYQQQVQLSVDTLSAHVKNMQDGLTPALDTMREVVEQAEEFMPKQRRN
ncbi:hypothetical protein ACFP9W_11055 [Tatumella terrea]|uniref:Anti-phage defense ZorAB system ZorA n=2 Tax=Erwiniaceae TaxID=1903409 RepID=A0ABW1W056_9GAMM|nr:hypothetical protein [Tatumella sp. JGM118]